MENKLNDLKPLYSRKKIFAFQKKLKKMFLPWRVNLADQSKQQPQEIKMRVTNLVPRAFPLKNEWGGKRGPFPAPPIF